MTDKTQDAIKKRLSAMTGGEEPYAGGEVFRSRVNNALNDAPLVITDEGRIYDRVIGADRKDLDTILADWVVGELDDDAALTKLFPLAVRYRDGVQIDDDIGDQITDPEEKLRHQFSQAMNSAYYNVVEEASEEVADKHLKKRGEVSFERDAGFSLDEMRRRLGIDRDRGSRDRCSTPDR